MGIFAAKGASHLVWGDSDVTPRRQSFPKSWEQPSESSQMHAQGRPTIAGGFGVKVKRHQQIRLMCHLFGQHAPSRLKSSSCQSQHSPWVASALIITCWNVQAVSFAEQSSQNQDMFTFIMQNISNSQWMLVWTWHGQHVSVFFVFFFGWFLQDAANIDSETTAGELVSQASQPSSASRTLMHSWRTGC